jgi:hypothetical protein
VPPVHGERGLADPGRAGNYCQGYRGLGLVRGKGSQLPQLGDATGEISTSAGNCAGSGLAATEAVPAAAWLRRRR